jgi:YidC/Oxa1 family membrane protein insertase
MSFIFKEFFYRPLFNALVGLYNLIPGDDFGLAIIVLTVVIRLFLSPLSFKTLRSQRELAKVQPKLKELQEKFKNDKQALSQATLALYREHNINPFGGCLPIIIQIPILFALYKAFSLGTDSKNLEILYPFVQNPGSVNNLSLNFIDLSKKAPYLAILAGFFQFIQAKISAKINKTNPAPGQDNIAQTLNRQMLYFFPAMIIIISWGLPSGIVVYWVTTTIYSIIEQLVFNRKHPSA